MESIRIIGAKEIDFIIKFILDVQGGGSARIKINNLPFSPPFPKAVFFISPETYIFSYEIISGTFDRWIVNGEHITLHTFSFIPSQSENTIILRVL